MNSLFPSPTQPADSDERYTPAWIFHHLGLRFDLDPCSPVSGADAVPADTRYTIEDDGLTQPWHGTVWVNPPFSNAKPWAERFTTHHNGIFLGPISNSKWRNNLLETADLIWLADDFAFTHPEHAGRRTSMPVMFAACGRPSTTALRRLHNSRVHRGVLLEHA